MVFAAPIYCCTVGSPARVVVELLSGKLAGKPIGWIVAAGTMWSALAHRDFLNSLSDEVNAEILPTKKPSCIVPAKANDVLTRSQ